MDTSRPKDKLKALGSAVKSKIADDCGVAMLEFVFVAPILCYLMIAVAFFHHHIDYAQDSIVRFRHLSWMRVPPNMVNISEAESDKDGFTPISSIRLIVQFAGAAGGLGGGGVSLGTLGTAERYYGGDSKTPYGRMHLRQNNYNKRQYQAVPITENPWAKPLGAIGHFFGNRFGGGTGKIPQGYNVNWEDKYPMIVDPWMRQLKRDDFADLAITENIVAKPVMVTMDVLTLFRSKTFSDQHKVDSVLDGHTRENKLKKTNLSKSKLETLVR